MAKITVGIFDEHKLTGMGLSAILEDISDVEVLFACSEKNILENAIKSKPVNIMIVNIHGLAASLTLLFQQIRAIDQRIKILAISALDTEEVVLNIIKSGANGFLSKDTERNELAEAIYTLRNGHDYFSKSITHLLLNKYIHQIKERKDIRQVDMSTLSARQIEILKLWGEGFSNQEIADKLFISIRTVESHKNHIMQKLNLKTTVDMVKFAIRNNLIEV